MTDTTRRSFVTSGASLAGAAMGTAAFCQPIMAFADETPAKADTTTSRSYTTYEFDVVVVGSGLSGLFAARKAIESGANVAVVDKGQFGHSGASGLNWGHALTTFDFNPDIDLASQTASTIYSGDGMVDQEFAYACAQAFFEAKPLLDAVQQGCVTEHVKNGEPVGHNTFGTGMSADATQEAGVFPRMFAQAVKRAGAQVFDYTFALDVLTDSEGRAVGIAAVDLDGGTPVVFKAKSVVLATGSFCQLCGWNGITPYTHGSADNTGDGTAMMLRLGIPMRDMEELCYDNGQYAPAGTRQCMTGMGVEITDHYRGFNKDYESFSQGLIEDKATYMNQGSYMRLEMREIWQGRGTEHGGIWALTDGLEDEERYYRRAKDNMKRVFDWDLPQYVELIPQCWETAGRPFLLDPASAQTEVPGLFAAGAGTYVWNGAVIQSCIGGGCIAGIGAAANALTAERGAVNEEQVERIFNDAYSILGRSGDDTVRARTVMRDVQTSFWDGMYFLRDEESITRAIDELGRIEREELPRMACPSHSVHFNLEWRNALETRNLLTCGLASANAALIRRECRGAHCRTDYPQVNNAEYMANTKVTFADGAWSAEMVEAGGPFMDHDTLVAVIPQVGIE